MSWWKRTTVYQIYPRSFADSNGDGIGDLRGIISRLDHLVWLGVETLWISPFFDSPQADLGYDVRDYRSVAAEYGTLDDVSLLIEEVHRRGMKIVFDLVLNHTSDRHAWFEASRSSVDDPHRDFYLWRKGRLPGGKAPPNNWKSMIGDCGWHYDRTTDEWFWATFLPAQPDLNWRNPAVKAAMLEVVRHWLGQGVDGLRLDLFSAIFKDAAFADAPLSLRPYPSEGNPDGFFQRAIRTKNLPETLAFARELRAVIGEFGDPERFLVGEVFAPTPVLRRYYGAPADGLNLVFLFWAWREKLTAPGMHKVIADVEASFADPLCPTWIFGNHDRPRAMLHVGDDPARMKLLAALQLTVRGVPFIYYGEELGLSHPSMPLDQAKDPLAARYRRWPQLAQTLVRSLGNLLNRDEARSPMPWDASANGGFSAPDAARSWLPTHPRARQQNVEKERDDEGSVLRAYRRLLALRRSNPALSGGRLELVQLPHAPRTILAYRRTDGANRVLVVLNFSSRSRLVAHGCSGATLHSSLRDVPRLALDEEALAPWEAIVLVP